VARLTFQSARGVTADLDYPRIWTP
jgi:hypothetical protein